MKKALPSQAPAAAAGSRTRATARLRACRSVLIVGASLSPARPRRRSGTALRRCSARPRRSRARKARVEGQMVIVPTAAQVVDEAVERGTCVRTVSGKETGRQLHQIGPGAGIEVDRAAGQRHLLGQVRVAEDDDPEAAVGQRLRRAQPRRLLDRGVEGGVVLQRAQRIQQHLQPAVPGGGVEALAQQRPHPPPGVAETIAQADRRLRRHRRALRQLLQRRQLRARQPAGQHLRQRILGAGSSRCGRGDADLASVHRLRGFGRLMATGFGLQPPQGPQPFDIGGQARLECDQQRHHRLGLGLEQVDEGVVALDRVHHLLHHEDPVQLLQPVGQRRRAGLQDVAGLDLVQFAVAHRGHRRPSPRARPPSRAGTSCRTRSRR
jgi:hypothetical protein